MDKTEGDVVIEGFLVRHCSTKASGSESEESTWKPRYFVLKGSHILYWKKRHLREQSPNEPHTIIDVSNSEVDKVTSLEGTTLPFPYCVKIATSQGQTFHLCAQEEENYKSWVSALRTAAGLPELPQSPVSQKKTHSRTLSKGGGLGATQKTPSKLIGMETVVSSQPIVCPDDVKELIKKGAANDSTTEQKDVTTESQSTVGKTQDTSSEQAQSKTEEKEDKPTPIKIEGKASIATIKAAQELVSKRDEIKSEVERARQRVLELTQSNKLKPANTITTRFPTKAALQPTAAPSSGIFSPKFAILLLVLLILYWYIF